MEINQKKKLEEKILDAFFQLLPDAPKGKLTPSESPDFILAINRRKTIGIELTRLIIEMENKQTHLDRELIIKALEKKNDKLPLYRKKRIDIYWLIIIIEDKSNNIILHQNTDRWTFETAFHKVFLFYPEHDQIMHIK
jgi:hypothetical protein